MSPTGPPPKSPQPGPAAPSSFRTMVRGALLVVALGLAGLYAYAMSNPSQTLEVRLVNQTGGVLKGLKLNDDAMGDLADGATAAANLPIAPSVTLALIADDVPRHTVYPYEVQAGRRHQLTINLVKDKDGSTEGRTTDTKFSVMFGTETTITEPIGDMDMLIERIDLGNSPPMPNRTLSPPTMTAPEAPAADAEKPAPAAEPPAAPDAPKAP